MEIIQHLPTLAILIFLQAVLGFDNLLYISLESKRAPKESQSKVRLWGIIIAIALRIVLLFLILALVDKLTSPMFGVSSKLIYGNFTFDALLTIFGGAFILYTAIKEVMHMISLEELHQGQEKKPASIFSVITMIVIMNLVFSFDTIMLSKEMTEQSWVMVVAIIVSGGMMILLADRVSSFLQKNRMYEVLGLFILFVVGILLLSEGGHKAGLSFWNEVDENGKALLQTVTSHGKEMEVTKNGFHVNAMGKGTFYFVIIVMIFVDIVQSRYQKKLSLKKREIYGELS